MPEAPRIAINGFGRIGRLALRALLELDDPFDVVAINDVTEPETLAHLFEHDSVHGLFEGTVELTDDGDLVVDGDRFHVLSHPEIHGLPWDDMDVDYVLECTGRFRRRKEMAAHLENGADRVILSAPAKDPIDATIVRGVNDDTYDPETDRLVSNASCTTNALAPTVQVLHEAFGVEHGLMTTIHAYTTSQNLHDGPHTDLRRARAAGVSMLPTSTGAARAIGDVLPELDGRLDGMAVRVPTPDVSLIDLVARLETDASTEQIDQAYRDAAEGRLEGILRVEDRELVSVDYKGEPASAVIDAPELHTIDDRLVKVLAWYDNEWGYALRTAELLQDMWGQEGGG